ncbi:MAG: inverse autotransporter beta domain-containing protein [Candidatus Theseobacter exili]|nr:inverse autotransporter beta domain-containing protein [Candidatus Theseobacter exili]
MRKNFFGKSVIVFLLLMVMFAGVKASFAQTPEQPQVKAPLPPAAVTLGGKFSSDDNTGYVDILAPVVGSDTAFLFIDPRVAISEGPANEQNVGIGGRTLVFDEKFIFGGNVFFDTRETVNKNRFNQVGVGGEMLTDWVDARINFYWPQDDEEIIDSYDMQESETSMESSWGSPYFTENTVSQSGKQVATTRITNRHYDRFEKALDGVDFEIGVRLPVLQDVMETRIFGGYYYYDNDYGKDIKGFKGRLEVRAMPALIFDAEIYENDELHGTDYYVGARLNVPFDFGNLFSGKNPFEGAKDWFTMRKRTMKERMTEMVIRDIDIILDESDYIEDASKLKDEVSVETRSLKAVLLDDITFVDKDFNGTSNGKYENPYPTIGKGVKKAFGKKYVYVSDAKSSYKENVTLRKNVKLWGSGEVIYGCESGKRPVIDGQGGPAVTMADKSQVYGFKLKSASAFGFVDLPRGTFPPGGGEYVVNPFGSVSASGSEASQIPFGAYGVVAYNVSDLVIRNNVINGEDVGVLIIADSLKELDVTIDQCTIKNSNDSGVVINAMYGRIRRPGFVTASDSYMGEPGESFKAVISNCDISENNSGVQISTFNYKDTSIDLLNSVFSKNYEKKFEGGGDVEASIPTEYCGVLIRSRYEREAPASGVSALGYTTPGGGSSTSSSDGGNYALNISDCKFEKNEGGLITAISGFENVQHNISSSSFAENKGVGFLVVAGSKSGNKFEADISNCNISKNGYFGARFDVDGFKKASINVKDTIANRNKDSAGIEGSFDNQKTVVNISGLEAKKNNHGFGLRSYLGTTKINMTGCNLSNNQKSGADINVYSKDNAIAKIFGENNVIANNGGAGLYIGTDPDVKRGYVDFGGGEKGSIGKNSIYGHEKYDIVNKGKSKVKAEYNWWGTKNPKPGKFGGKVDYSKPLSNDPNAK